MRPIERSENRRLGLKACGLEGRQVVCSVVEIFERGKVRIRITEIVNEDFLGPDAIEKIGRAELVGSEELFDFWQHREAVDGGEGVRELAVDGDGDVVVAERVKHGADEAGREEGDVATGRIGRSDAG